MIQATHDAASSRRNKAGNDHEGLAQKPFKGHVDVVVQQVERVGGVIIAEFLVSLFVGGELGVSILRSALPRRSTQE